MYRLVYPIPRIQPINNTAQNPPIQSTDNIGNQISADKSVWTKGYVAAAIAGGLVICGLFAAIMVPFTISIDRANSESVQSMLIPPANNPTTTVSSVPVCPSNASLITFDNILSQTAVPNGYSNMNWPAAQSRLPTTSNGGLYTAVVSTPTVIYNGLGVPMTMQSANGSLFNLYSFAAAAAWRDNLQLTVAGYRSNVTIALNTYTLQVFSVSYLTFTGYVGLSKIIFTASGGTQNPNVTSSIPVFGMDNLCLEFI